MRAVTLLFPDNLRLVHFLINSKINGAEVRTREHSLAAVLEDEQIKTALTTYGAITKHAPVLNGKSPFPPYDEE